MRTRDTEQDSVWGWLSFVADWKGSYEGQAVLYPLTQPQFTPQAEVLTFQMGNVLLLLAAMALICSWTPHSEVTKWYLISVAVADLGHIYTTYRGNSQHFWEPATWNAHVCGNIISSAFLFMHRVATVLGLFGPLRSDAKSIKKRI